VPVPKESTQFRHDNNISNFLVLYAGNFARYQDFDTLLDAAKALKNREDITFAFVGEGVKKAHIASRIANEELSNVRMLPFVPESQLCDMLGAADVSLVTLERGIEGLAVPSKFYNIMASGRATIACVPKVSEVAQVIAETDCGVQVDQENAQALANVIQQLADDPETLERMGRNARRACEDRYGLNHVGRQFHHIFNDVVARRNKRNATGKSKRMTLAAAHTNQRSSGDKGLGS
jgi:glycosyltransferase involved in cell wall biosynthesis